MRKLNTTSEKLGIIAFTTIQVLCVFIAAAFALDEYHGSIYVNAIGALGYLSLALLCEWVKYKITHPEDITQG